MIYVIFYLIYRIVLALDFLIFTTLMYCLSWLPKVLRSGYYLRLFRLWCWAFIRALGVNLHLQQKNIKPLPKQFILIANHPSAFEDIGIPAFFDVTSLAKIELKHWPVGGRISTASGSLYVNRESKKSRRAAFDALKKTLEEGKNVAIYPEGGCKGRRLADRFQYGAFDLSIQTGVPIVPVFLHYEAQEDFEWAEQTLMYKLYQFVMAKNNRATYYVFDAFDPKAFRNKEEYTHFVYQQYKQWQEKYLE